MSSAVTFPSLASTLRLRFSYGTSSVPTLSTSLHFPSPQISLNMIKRFRPYKRSLLGTFEYHFSLNLLLSLSLFRASRFSKSILSPSQYQLALLDFEVMSALRALRASEIERAEIEERMRSEPLRGALERAQASSAQNQRARPAKNVLVID